MTETEDCRGGTGSRRVKGEVSKVEKEGEVVVLDVIESGEWEGEELCRVCHLSREVCGLGTQELIRIGCGCRGELAVAHRDCGEAWFKVKGNRYCEICHMYAKNIIGEDDSGFMEEWHEGRGPPEDGLNRSMTERRVSCWRGQRFCNILLGCVIIALIFLWFFHIK